MRARVSRCVARAALALARDGLVLFHFSDRLTMQLSVSFSFVRGSGFDFFFFFFYSYDERGIFFVVIERVGDGSEACLLCERKP